MTAFTERLITLGFSEKEATVYLALLELGQQPASVVARKTGFPRPTVLFLFESLTKRGFVRKSRRGRAQFFYADPGDLKKVIDAEMLQRQETLDEILPLFQEVKNPLTSPPRVMFFEGMDGCRKAYSLLLESSSEIWEFAAHEDLVKMGESFMKKFVEQRVKHGIRINSICRDTPVHRMFKNLDKKHLRKLRVFPKTQGELYSSIDVFEHKVLLLNLYHDPFAILVENKEFADTLRTIHGLVWRSLSA